MKVDFKDFIGVYENAFTVRECEDVIKVFEIFNENKLTYDRNDLIVSDDNSCDIPHVLEMEMEFSFQKIFQDRFFGCLYPIYLQKYPTLEVMSRHMPRYMKVQKTLPCQGYHLWHQEHNGTNDARDRILAWILYLNDVEEGGETEFLYQSLRLKPKTGTFVLWPAAFTHAHRGNPPLSGKKYIATGWVDYINVPEMQGKLRVNEKEMSKIMKPSRSNKHFSR